jgi:hypothetical protein
MLIGNVYYNRINTENHTNWWEWDFYSEIAKAVSEDKLVKKYNFRVYLTDPCKIDPKENDIVIFTSFETYDILDFIDIPFLIFKQYVNQNIPNKLYGLPLGLNYPIIHTPNLPISQRKIDLCFLGQYENRYNRKHIIDFIKSKFSNRNIVIGSDKSVVEYYLTLSNSKISLCLDGGMVPEAYRFFEALKYGCIAIANESLLNLDIYKNAPFIPVNWNNLNEVENKINFLLNDSSNLDDISHINNTFWQNNYSQKAQVNFIIDKIHKKIYNSIKQKE